MLYPAAFTSYRQFVLYKLIPKPNGKTQKLPVDPHTLQPFPKGEDWQHDATRWTDGQTAVLTAKACGANYGVGFLFTDKDPFYFVDIDACLTGGAWSDLSKDILLMFPGCYVEVSQSGTGLHVFGSGTPSTEHACKNTQLGLEFYTRERFVALTGTQAVGDAATICNPDHFIAKYMQRAGVEQPLGWTSEPVEGYQHLEDAELIKRALRSGGAGSIFGERATFADLWNCNERILAKAYTSDSGNEFDRSSADAALAQHLAFWTGRNCERIQALMWQSELRRDKWDREDYIVRTIQKAVDRQTDVYTGPDERRQQQLQENAVIGEDKDTPVHTPILILDEMLEQLVFIGGQHAVGNIKTKTVRKKNAAVDEYAASYHTFIDPDTRAEKSTPALKTWLARKDRKSVESVTWAPGQPELCLPPEGQGLAFNTWAGLRILSPPSDWNIKVQPWVDHVNFLAGDETHAFMQWLAHIFQNPGQVPHTCYLHTTPQTGTGRNWMAGVLTRALRGHVASGVDISKVLEGGFNGRLSQKLLTIVDEVHEGGDFKKRLSRGEKLKQLITQEMREIDFKHGLQLVEFNCCRWLMFSNHLDALPFDNSDRRVNVVENPTVRKSPEYFTKLYSYIYDKDFIASVWQYLITYDLSDYNPYMPAQINEAKQNALDAMSSEIDFAVEEFKREWPSDVAAFSQVLDYVGPCSETHLRHVLTRCGMQIIKNRVQTLDGRRSRVVVLRGDKRDAEGRRDLRDACIEAGTKYQFLQSESNETQSAPLGSVN